jgi:hypothetical protein
VGQLHQQNGELRGIAQQLQVRLEEEGEVVSALRAQLVDYKLQVRCNGCNAVPLGALLCCSWFRRQTMSGI